MVDRRKHRADVRQGAEALKALILSIQQQGDADLEAHPDLLEQGVDTRDYRRMAQAIRAAIDCNLVLASAEHAEGFLRGLADLFSQIGDSGLGPGASWDPIAVTARSFGEAC